MIIRTHIWDLPYAYRTICLYQAEVVHIIIIIIYIYLMIIVIPTATTPAMVIAYEGENVTITCTAAGISLPSVNWTRANGCNLTDNRYVISNTSSSVIVNYTYQVTRNLTIMNIVREDAGVYSCLVTNGMGTAQTKSNVNITVLCKLIIIYNYVTCSLYVYTEL